MLDYLKPLPSKILNYIQTLSSQHFGSKVVLHKPNDFPNLENIKIAIIGVKENRASTNTKNIVDLNPFRKELYQLFAGNWNQTIADLGDIDAGNEIKDTYFALQKVCESLLKIKIIPLIIGGTQDLTYPIYRAYDNLEQMVNLVTIDNKFDFGKEEEEITENSYLTKIITQEPNNLFNFSNVGYQSYFNSQEEIDLIEKLYFDAYRLGEVSNSLAVSEPVFRDADFVSLDLNAVQSSFSGNFIDFNPNGFTGKEICTLSRYAGISDRISTFGVFNHQNTEQESKLIAQIVWYFIEGFHYRSQEYPYGSKAEYLKYIVLIDNEEFVFYKSNKTERWWIEIKYLTVNKSSKTDLLPCTNEDYLSACNHEIPERWWKAQRKNMV
jgi:arginase family enzyme